VAAEIIEFPNRGHEDRLVNSVARLEQIVREVDRVAVGQPPDGLDHLLAVMERLGDRLVDLAYPLLDEDGKRSVRNAFTSLSQKIAETRDAVCGPSGGMHP
jgi:hypothetical protein